MRECAAIGAWLCAPCLRFTVEDATAIAAALIRRPRIESARPREPAVPTGPYQVTLTFEGDGVHKELRRTHAAKLAAAQRKGRSKQAWRNRKT